jgi:hypothetical protein
MIFCCSTISNCHKKNQLTSKLPTIVAESMINEASNSSKNSSSNNSKSKRSNVTSDKTTIPTAQLLIQVAAYR